MNNDSMYRVIAENVGEVQSVVENQLRAADPFGDGADIALDYAVLIETDRDTSICLEVGWRVSDGALHSGEGEDSIGTRYFVEWRNNSRAWSALAEAATRSLQDCIEKFDGRRPSEDDVAQLLNRGIDGDHSMESDDEGEDGYYLAIGGVSNRFS